MLTRLVVLVALLLVAILSLVSILLATSLALVSEYLSSTIYFCVNAATRGHADHCRRASKTA